VVVVASPEELTSLMSADDYQEYVADEE